MGKFIFLKVWLLLALVLLQKVFADGPVYNFHFYTQQVPEGLAQITTNTLPTATFSTGSSGPIATKLEEKKESVKDEFAHKSAINIGIGVMAGTYSGAAMKYHIGLTPTVYLGHETFTAVGRSFVLSSMLASNDPTGPMYIGLFFERRYYFGDDNDNSNWRYFAGWDLGLANLTLKEYGAGMVLHSLALDAGIDLGAIYKITDSFGICARLGASFNYGLSAYQATGITASSVVGFAYNF
ncbi:MAG: hypothetical protein A2504_12860 [Bdellovibrionales bacterium RIFOXYD12_FULL_39_22]|nr:MAG: hypothetical protein A2385_03945 [Bdellovibrionales bacterium RIFOXYB1_FULL_39_21]OFZ40505.1 MAG: hypothetical protein A2485_02810 [Bdellovibrionales bacterium RIFOXYC12_FULL_39_17]OFZ49988.1 MAG: hypothetical protein A2404_02145 [Bdellovibrionales bacterium RIFOXYC1_FULL_39_130]OFZ73380.1 MAG: hypothetical protein A2451_04540 [Bdellovibrionales bacterium RIFOXYC2_FULL_39_8]OFZ77630.1 MAG: hypothetical protein A2560_04705 [Bdellovibrionales bacterium RIFOXYD1_FULL_39_84]OFZ96084.1 MAG: